MDQRNLTTDVTEKRTPRDSDESRLCPEGFEPSVGRARADRECYLKSGVSLLIIPSSFAVKDLRHLPYVRCRAKMADFESRYHERAGVSKKSTLGSCHKPKFTQPFLETTECYTSVSTSTSDS